MDREAILQELASFWEKLRYYGLRLAEIPKAMLRDPDSYSSASKLKVGAVVLILAAVVLLWLVKLLKAPGKKKLGILFRTLALLLIVSAIAYFALLELPTPDAAEASRTPATVTVNGEELTAAGAYKLAVGPYDPRFLMNYADWGLTNAVTAFRLNDGSILYLSGLDSLPGGDGVFMTRTLRENYAHLYRLHLSGLTEYNDYADVSVFRGTTLRALGLSGAPGSVMADPLQNSDKIEILESGEDRLLFLHFSDWTAFDGEPLVGLCQARQLGNDVIRVNLHSVVGHGEMAGFDCSFHDPREDGTQLERMREVLDAFFDGRVRILRGLTGEEAAALLPTRIAEGTEHFASYNGRFSISCSRLLSLESDDAGHAAMRWLGENADGETVLYTLRNNAVASENGETGTFKAWKDAFEAGKATPDREMSDFLGCRAVAWEGGWLLNPASVYLNSSSMVENYYYLTVEAAGRAQG